MSREFRARSAFGIRAIERELRTFESVENEGRSRQADVDLPAEADWLTMLALTAATYAFFESSIWLARLFDDTSIRRRSKLRLRFLAMRATQ